MGHPLGPGGRLYSCGFNSLYRINVPAVPPKINLICDSFRFTRVEAAPDRVEAAPDRVEADPDRTDWSCGSCRFKYIFLNLYYINTVTG